MPAININLTSFAVILYAGMMVIAGSIWVLSSQVRRLSDLVEEHIKATATATGTRPAARRPALAAIPVARHEPRRNVLGRDRVVARVSALSAGRR